VAADARADIHINIAFEMYSTGQTEIGQQSRLDASKAFVKLETWHLALMACRNVAVSRTAVNTSMGMCTGPVAAVCL